ncbi:TetR/AcrR family transcriptional regulator [Salinispira pacifica]
MTRAERKANTREAIVAAATRLFSERGLLAVTTAEVAGAAGVSHGALFVHFPRREDLQQEVISRTGTRIARALHEAAAVAHGEVRQILRAHLRAIAGEEAFYAHLLIEGPLLGFEARSALVGVQSAVAHHLFAEGGLKLDDSAIWFNTWLGLVHHYILNRDLFAPGGSVVDRYGEHLIEHFAGILDRRPEMEEQR